MLHSIYQQIWKTQQWPQDWKSQFSFQSQRKAMPKYVQTTTQLHSFHMWTRSCSKSSKIGFNRMWTENFQVFKLDLEKARNQRSNCQHSLDHRKARKFQKNIYFCFIDYTKTFDCVYHNKLWEILKRWEYQNTSPASWEISMQIKKQQLELDMEQHTDPK